MTAPESSNNPADETSEAALQNARAERLARISALERSVPPHLADYALEDLKESAADHGYRQLFDLKDEAISTIRLVMQSAKPETRLSAANSVLDRIGMHAKNQPQNAENTPISASDFVKALSTLGRVFGAADDAQINAIEAHFKELPDES